MHILSLIFNYQQDSIPFAFSIKVAVQVYQEHSAVPPYEGTITMVAKTIETCW
jgi:hypothetical protein